MPERCAVISCDPSFDNVPSNRYAGSIHIAQRLLQAEMKSNSSTVHTVARYYTNDLVKLKEDVILFHWNAKDRITPKW